MAQSMKEHEIEDMINSEKKTNEDILATAIKVYGKNAQLDMVVEECAELIQAINKIKRISHGATLLNYPNSRTGVKYSLAYFNLCSEVADVKIMLKQMEIMLSKEAIDLAVERKMERLSKRLNDGE